MPLIKPRKYERKQKFIARFMDNKRMKKEYPKRKRRLAVAYAVWEIDKS